MAPILRYFSESQGYFPEIDNSFGAMIHTAGDHDGSCSRTRICVLLSDNGSLSSLVEKRGSTAAVEAVRGLCVFQ
jgi:hypothetical protein